AGAGRVDAHRAGDAADRLMHEIAPFHIEDVAEEPRAQAGRHLSDGVANVHHAAKLEGAPDDDAADHDQETNRDVRFRAEGVEQPVRELDQWRRIFNVLIGRRDHEGHEAGEAYPLEDAAGQKQEQNCPGIGISGGEENSDNAAHGVYLAQIGAKEKPIGKPDSSRFSAEFGGLRAWPPLSDAPGRLALCPCPSAAPSTSAPPGGTTSTGSAPSTPKAPGRPPCWTAIGGISRRWRSTTASIACCRRRRWRSGAPPPPATSRSP